MKYIIAGGPSCGKTSLVKELGRRGHKTVDEAAREVIKEGRLIPGTSEFQVEIFKRQVQREDACYESAFFDRSALEGITYSKLFMGRVPRELAEFDFRGRYTWIFILERLPFVDDGERVERDDAEAERVHNAIAMNYLEHGYSPLFVPLFPGKIEESLARRADYVLNLIGGKDAH